LQLTDSGTVLVRFARQVTHLEREVHHAFGRQEPGELHRIAIAVNADSLATWFLPAIERACDQLPISVELHREDQDHTAELLRQGLVMAAVTSSPQPVPGCRVHKLGSMRYRPTASPEFISRWLPEGATLGALGTAPSVIFDRKDDLQDRYLRRLRIRPGPNLARHYVPSSEAFVEAVALGLGWGMIPEAQSLAQPARLVDVDPEHPIDVPLFWQQWKLDSPALTALSAAVTGAAQETLRPG
jgi:LysR family transcriptional regulator (chromosome initiation inhibitor)